MSPDVPRIAGIAILSYGSTHLSLDSVRGLWRWFWVEMGCLIVAAGRDYDGIGEKHGSKILGCPRARDLGSRVLSETWSVTPGDRLP